MRVQRDVLEVGVCRVEVVCRHPEDGAARRDLCRIRHVGRRDGGADHLAADLVAGVCDGVRPLGVDVAGEEDRVLAQAAEGVDEAAALEVVAVPLVAVERELVELGDWHLGGEDVGAQRLGDRASGGVVKDGASVQWGEHHGVAQRVPRGGRVLEGLGEPVELLGAEHRAGVARLAGAALPKLDVAVGAQVHDGQLHQVAELQGAVDVALLRSLRQAHGHPLVVGAQRGVAPGVEIPLARVVVLRALAPVVVGNLVVVPHHHPRHGRVGTLQRGVRAVPAVADAVIGQADNLVRGLVQAHRPVPRVLVLGVLVDVVAQEDGQVELTIPAALGHVRVCGEEAGLPVRAGGDRPALPVHLPCRGGLRAAQGGGGLRVRAVYHAEGVVVHRVRLQTGDVHVDGVVLIRLTCCLALLHHLAHLGVERHAPAHRGGGAATGAGHCAFLGRDAGPDHHRLRQRVARRDAVHERQRRQLRLHGNRLRGQGTLRLRAWYDRHCASRGGGDSRSPQKSPPRDAPASARAR